MARGFSEFKYMTFDVVGTLIDFEGGITTCLAGIAAEAGVSIDGEEALALYRQARYMPDANLFPDDLARVYTVIAPRLGLPADPRKFSPHVTLARLRNSSPADVAQYLSARGNFSTLPFRVGRFVLMSSRDSVGGGPYIVEEAWPLVGADPLASTRFASASDASRIMR
ncbi:2'-5' RNA ligase family protein [Mesorhizobium sp.]|uniref:2'-5' RNA ligase family protein n=1 Tax=Mesorhizobium sp. TaxID=1871066 RepID=UPI0025C1D051|nr:2'-5' RNA ligase family protein [Mesorhizobium sp.]